MLLKLPRKCHFLQSGRHFWSKFSQYTPRQQQWRSAQIVSGHTLAPTYTALDTPWYHMSYQLINKCNVSPPYKLQNRMNLPIIDILTKAASTIISTCTARRGLSGPTHPLFCNFSFLDFSQPPSPLSLCFPLLQLLSSSFWRKSLKKLVIQSLPTYLDFKMPGNRMYHCSISKFIRGRTHMSQPFDGNMILTAASPY